MVTRLHLEDWRIIGHYLGVLILLVAVAMIPPFVASLCLAEFSASVDFMLSIGITAVVGSVLLFSATAHRHPYTPAQEPRTEHLRLEISRKQTVSAMHDLHRTTRYRKIPKRIFVFSAKQGFTLFRR